MKNVRTFIACFTVLIMLGFPFSCKAHVFMVGGNDGWVLHPSERYDHWAERNRFQVNDMLLFKYSKGSDSVLLVTRDDFASCNTKNPIQTLNDGESRFVFDRSGPFFFVSGNPSNCNGGQKLLVQVLAVRDRAPPPNPTKELQPPPPATVTAPPPPGQEVQPPETGSGPSGRNSSSSTDAPAPAPSSASSMVNGVAVAFGSVAICMAMFRVRV